MPATVQQIAGLQMNAAKAIIRTDITSQFMHFFRTAAIQLSDVYCMTLPGTNFMFETTLTSAFDYYFKRERATEARLHFNCFELKRDRFDIARRQTPENCDYHLQDLLEAEHKHYDFVWLDFCSTIVGSANYIPSMIDKLVSKCDRPMLFYITQCMQRVNHAKFAKQHRIREKTHRGIIETFVERTFINRNMGFAKVYSVHYAGGTKGKSSMLTIGYMVTPSRSATGRAAYNMPALIQEDRTKQGEHYGRHVARLRKSYQKRHYMPMPDRDIKDFLRMVRLGMDQRALAVLAPHWKTLPPSDRTAYAHKLVMSTRQVASKLCWLSGKLRKINT